MTGELSASPGSKLPKTILFIAALLVVALVAAVIVWVRHSSNYTVTSRLSDGTTVKVVSPRSVGKPTIGSAPAPSSASLPAATKLLSPPIDIAAKPFHDSATVTMSYDPSKLPSGIDLATDLFVMTYVKSLGLWLPVDGPVDSVHHTVTAETTHFSEWVVAVTDPEALAEQTEFEERLKKSTGGKLGALLAGSEDSLDCDSQHYLLAAKALSVAGYQTKMCQELLQDGSYRLQWVNTTSLPVKFDLPAGMEQAVPNRHSDVLTTGAIEKLLGKSHPHAALVGAGESLDLRFKSDAVTPDTQVRGDIAWNATVLVLERQVTEAALEDEDNSNANLRNSLDAVFSATNIYDCAADATKDFSTSRVTEQALVDAMKECAPEVAKAVALTVNTALGYAKQKITKLLKFVEKRVLAVLSIPNWLKLARTEIAALLTASFKPFGLDTHIVIEPTRIMTRAEAVSLPLTQADPEPSSENCRRFKDSVFLPLGMPSHALCAQSIALDLNGNSDPDRLILWRPALINGGDGPAPAQVGAVAYLDNGTFRILDNPPASWRGSRRETSTDVEMFDFVRSSHIGNDSRTQAMVRIIQGANTGHDVIVSLGHDNRLHAATQSDTTAPVMDVATGGGILDTSAFGCVLSNKRPLFVEKSVVAETFDNEGPSTYSWFLSYYAFDGVRLTHVGDARGTSNDNGSHSGPKSTPSPGSDCSKANPAKRGPEIGPVRTTTS